MPRQEGIEWGFFFDPVHVISVNYARGEARLFENGGSGKNRLLFKKDEPAAKISLSDPYQMMNLAIHFVVSYDLLAQVADEDTVKFFEQVGIKDFLEKLAAATSDEERRLRFTGLVPKFSTFFSKEARPGGQSPPANDKKAEEPPPPTNGSDSKRKQSTPTG